MKVVAVPDYPGTSRLSHYLDNVAKGRKVDLRSPLYDKDLSRESITRKWDGIFNTFSLPSELEEIENKERDKIGPFSIQLSWEEREKDLEPYFRPPIMRVDAKKLDLATARLENLLPKDRLRPTSLETSYRKAAKSTNWGLPFFEKGKTKGEEYLALARKDWSSGKLSRFPAVVGWRGQPNGTDTPKQRIVWMFPHNITLIESCFLEPLLSALKVLDEFAAWNDLDVVDNVVTQILRTADASKLPVLGYDASSFDASVNRELTKRVFGAIKLWFQPEFSSILDDIEDNFSTSGIVTPSGLHLGRDGAVPSGSGLTNMVDSLVHLLQFFYMEESLGALNKGSCTCLGDDGVWVCPDLDVDNLKEIVAELGFTANPLKQYVSFKSTTYLQRYHSLYMVNSEGLSPGVRSTYRCLNGMLSYERIVKGWSGQMDSVRWIMQLENCKHHPAHAKLVHFAKAGDEKFGLGANLAGGVRELTRSVGGPSNIAKTLRIASFPYTERDPSKLESFRTVKVLTE